MTTFIGASPQAVRATGANLPGAAVPVFSLIAVITRTTSLDSLRDLEGTAVRLMDQFRSAAGQAGAGPDEIDAASYALAATLDELALTREWGGRLAWQDAPLAKRYCRDEFVGVGFYDELAKVRRTPGERAGVLEIFYYCLVAGFRGQLVDDPAQVEKLLRELSTELRRPGELVPDAELDRPSFGDQIREFPYMLVLLVCGTVAFVWYVVASLLVNASTSAMVEKLGG